MAETKSMTAEQVVGYLLEGDGLDLRVSRFPGSCSGCWRRRCRSWLAVLTVSERRRSAWRIATVTGRVRGRRAPGRSSWRSRDPPRLLLSRLSRAARAGRAGAGDGGAGGLRRGVSTRKVDQVVESLGIRVSKSEVSRICAGLDEQVEACRNRPLEGRYPLPLARREGREGLRRRPRLAKARLDPCPARF